MQRERTILLLSLALSVATQAVGQSLDHVKCYKVTGGGTVRYTLDLETADPAFADSGCRVVSRTRFVCVPATAANVQSATVPPAPPFSGIDGAALTTPYTCYKVRCPGSPPDLPVADRFQGEVPLRRYRAELLCMPAAFGSTTTTTTTTTTSTTLACENALGACTSGSCPSGQTCGNLGGRCGCVDSLPVVCGDAQAPTCNGLCPAGETCSHPGLGSQGCTCLPDGTTLCSQAGDLQCDGACAPDAFCVSFGDSCVCYPLAVPCGQVASAPTCFGSCPAATPICRDAGGSCVCMP